MEPNDEMLYPKSQRNNDLRTGSVVVHEFVKRMEMELSINMGRK